MPRLEVEGVGVFDVEDGKRLVLAIEEDTDVAILRRAGPKPKQARDDQVKSAFELC